MDLFWTGRNDMISFLEWISEKKNQLWELMTCPTLESLSHFTQLTF